MHRRLCAPRAFLDLDSLVFSRMYLSPGCIFGKASLQAAAPRPPSRPPGRVAVLAPRRDDVSALVTRRAMTRGFPDNPDGRAFVTCSTEIDTGTGGV